MMELLAPAGGLRQLKAALRFGADAVYGGLRRFGLRSAASNFDWDELREALRLAHSAGKRFYLTLNILPYDEDLESMISDAEKASAMGIDGAIVSDIGALSLLRKACPDLPLHVSTQANVMNSAAAEVFVRMGASRIVLSRELSLDRIAAIRKRLPPDVQLEAFVHGAMCMSHSGRCMLSDYLTGRSANKGSCAQPCRYEYTVLEAKRPDEPMPVLEDERGTYIFSAYDLNMLGFLPEMRQAGIASLKIEGRMKTDYYVASITRVYRFALDRLAESEEAYRSALPELQKELLKVSHRKSNTGFYFGDPHPASGAEHTLFTMNYLGRIIDSREGYMTVEVKNRFQIGDRLEVLSPSGVHEFTLSRITLTETGEELRKATIAGQKVEIPVSFKASPGDYLRGQNLTE